MPGPLTLLLAVDQLRRQGQLRERTRARVWAVGAGRMSGSLLETLLPACVGAGVLKPLPRERHEPSPCETCLVNARLTGFHVSLTLMCLFHGEPRPRNARPR